MAATVSVLMALELGGKDYAWDSWQIVGLFVLCALAAALFIGVDADGASGESQLAGSSQASTGHPA